MTEVENSIYKPLKIVNKQCCQTHWITEVVQVIGLRKVVWGRLTGQVMLGQNHWNTRVVLMFD